MVAQLLMYEQLRNELAIWVRDLSGEEFLAHAENILSRLVRLAQLASNPRLLDASYTGSPASYRALDKLMHVYLADPSRKAIIWTSFVPNIPTPLSRPI